MKKPVKGKKIPVIRFGPSVAGPKPVPQRIAYVELIIDERGNLLPPTLADVNTGDSISWLVTNNSNKNAQVRNKKFKKHDVELTPIDFDRERVTVHKNGGTATIIGRVRHLPKDDADQIKYTVEVRGPRDADYDPDLIIRRPAV